MTTAEKRMREIQETLDDTSLVKKARAYNSDVSYLLEQLEQLSEQLRAHHCDSARLARLVKLEEGINAAGYRLPAEG